MHTAKLFKNGRSQAVRLPKEYALGAADKAAIQRVEVPPCQLPDSGT